ncbi:4-hydroxythreonine-4-phosphate dehydrogenase PdxA [Spirosoma taeanense]|uniref:4-hydroxythreonine-4-phosphate dehydrogenase PdxA n=1 Tax=Spirosoma taeanense TaxID=2735870 RepID=A0A6M5Y5I3_9BACT|nr:4-hydroxythreonine-4-phosphate dehydrogenase PdxA [Spirosoma taeanense]QJW88714.1 4-hydroxythreonine-4-phosphate dehydrogenase PdxA [Spirosoma taeanense]
MEQRQPNEPNDLRNDPPAGPDPEARPDDTQPSQPQAEAEQPTGSQPGPTERRENRQPNGRNNPPGNRPDGQRPEGQRQNGPNPRDNRQRENRNSRDAGPRDAKPQDEATGQPENRQRENRNDRDRNNPPREREAQMERDGSEMPRGADTSGFDRPERSSRQGGRDLGNESGESSGREDRLVIGISLGDYNGIGPEVILKALQYNRLQKICTPVIYGSMRVLNRYRNLLNMKDWNLNGAPTIGQISHKMTNVITCWPDQNQDIQPGQVTPEAGQAAFACLQRAVDDLKEGKLDALVTAPINKYNIQSEEFKFPGHTEYLAQEFGVPDNLMFMVSETLRVGVVTGHVPLGRVRQNITRDRIAQKLTLMMQSLKQDFGIEKPKIAVLGLNPHAGEEGLLGNEEQDIIKPLLAEWRNKGQLVFGPYPADGFFGTRGYKKFDAVLAMYHDQGLIPFKSIAFEEGVNFTAGMPVVRTSPDHGTAYDIAGKDLADETSMLQAIYTAVDVARQRREYMELEAGALK